MSDFDNLDYYELLGVPRTASLDEIKRAYRREISKYHPDRFVNGTPAEQEYASLRSQRLTEAYGVLGDFAARSAYNRGQPHEARSARAPRPAGPPQPRDHQAELYEQAIGHLNAERPLQAIGALRQLQQINPFYRNSAELLATAESQLNRRPERPAGRVQWPLIVTGGVAGVALIALAAWAIGLRGATASRGAAGTSPAALVVSAAPTRPPAPTFAPVEPTAAPTAAAPTAEPTAEPATADAPTAEPVAAPSATPAGEQGTLLLGDRFASGGWANINGGSWRVGYQRGRYAVRGEPNTGAIWSYRIAPASDVSIGVDVQVAAGEGGLLVRFLDANNYVSITLNPSQTSFRVEQHSGGGTNVLAGGQSEAITLGADARNRLVARVRGDHVEVLVNGQPLAAIDARGAPDSARYGLLVIAKDSASEAYFDNLEIRSLDS